MKLGKTSKMLGVVLSIVLLAGMTGMPAPAQANDAFILTEGWVSGNVTVTGENITGVTVSAMDTDGEFSASTTVSVPGGASSLSYNLTVESEPTVEGDRAYYVIANAKVVATDDTRVIFPVTGNVTVPAEATVTHDMSVEPAFISGNISTTDSGNTIQAFTLYARIYVPEFGSYFHNTTTASGLSVPGLPGRDYTLLVAPGLDYSFYGYVTINSIQYNVSVGTVTAPAAGDTLTQHILIDVTAAWISGNATLLGPEAAVDQAIVQGKASIPPPFRSALTTVDVSTGNYTLDVDAGIWNVQPYFEFHLTTGNLAGKWGRLVPPTTAVNVTAGDNITGFDLIIDPGFITGTVSLTGANTDISSGEIRARSHPNGWMYATIHEETGEYMFVASSGNWTYQGIYLGFDYPLDPDPYLRSSLNQWGYFFAPYTVTSDNTVSGLDLTYGTATVRLYYYVAGGGELSSPYFHATREGTPSLTVDAWGSPIATVEGQVMGTLFPGTYTIDAFATVGASVPKFGTSNITVEEGDVVVIGGPGRPTIHITNPTGGAMIPAASVTVNGTATDPEGIALITINGDNVTFTSTGGPDNEVAFSHEVSLPDVGENTITVVATDVDPTPHSVTLTLTVIREDAVIAVEIDIKPGSYPNSINLGSEGVVPIAILTTDAFDAATVDPLTVTLADADVRIKGKSGNVGSLEDVDGDGDLDLVVQIYTEQLQITEGDVVAVLKGATFDGTPIEGSDSVRIVQE